MTDRGRKSFAKSDITRIFPIDGRPSTGRTRVGVGRAISEGKVGVVRKVSDGVVNNRVNVSSAIRVLALLCLELPMLSLLEILRLLGT